MNENDLATCPPSPSKDTRQIELSQGFFTTVSTSSYEKAMLGSAWQANVKFRRDGSVLNVYAGRDITTSPGGRGHRNRKHQRLHRVLMGITDPKLDVHHIDGDGLNNTLENLLVVTRSQNLQAIGNPWDNTSGYKGVSLFANGKGWRAEARADCRYYYVGRFATAIEAARARDMFIIEHGFEFSFLNFPREDYP